MEEIKKLLIQYKALTAIKRTPEVSAEYADKIWQQFSKDIKLRGDDTLGYLVTLYIRGKDAIQTILLEM